MALNVLLINPPIREWAKPNCIPIGMGYIASCLRNAGHSVEIFDINAHRQSKDEVIRILESKNPDLICTGGLITVYNYLKWLTSQLKKIFPDVPVVMGGSVSTSIPEISLKTMDADIACIGEGEITVLEIAEKIEENGDLSDVKGICYFKDGKFIKNPERPPIENLDSLPFPAYDLIDMDVYANNPVGYINKDKWGSGEKTDSRMPKSININVTRGCPYRCSFCYHDYLGPGFRHRSPENVLSEMDFLYENYGVTYFLWADDESVINKKFIYEFCDLMKKSKRVELGYQFCISGRVNLVDEKMLCALKEAGCNMVGYGIESGSQRILDAMNKKVTVEQSKNAISLTRKVFGDVDTSFMVGFPGENDETLRETRDFCIEMDLAPEVIFFATAYPGTPLYEYAIERGMIEDEVEYISGLWEQGEQIAINFTEWTDEELFEKRQKLIGELKAWNKERHLREDNI